MTVIQTRRLVTERAIDILVYLDLGMDPAAVSWAAARLAPLQACVWGHPSTTGLSSMDFYLSSHLLYEAIDAWTSSGASSVSRTPPLASTRSFSSAETESDRTPSIRINSLGLNRFVDLYPLFSGFPLVSPHPGPWEGNPWTGAEAEPDFNRPNKSVSRVTDPQHLFSEQLVLFDSLGFCFKRATLTDPPVPTADKAPAESSRQDGDDNSWSYLRPPSYYDKLMRYYEDTLHSRNDPLRAVLEMKRSGSRDSHMSRLSTNTLVLCPQHLPKFHPYFDTVLLNLLHQRSDLYLVLTYDSKTKGMWRRTLMERWRSYGAHTSLNTTDLLARVIWLDRLSAPEYLLLLSAGDLMIDPYPFGGGVTSLEALSVGTPVVTAPALQTVPRLTAGMLRRMLNGGSAVGDRPRVDERYLEVEEEVDSLLRLLIVPTAQPQDVVTRVLDILHEPIEDGDCDDRVTACEDSSERSSGMIQDHPIPRRRPLLSLLQRVRRAMWSRSYSLFGTCEDSTKEWRRFIQQSARSVLRGGREM